MEWKNPETYPRGPSRPFQGLAAFTSRLGVPVGLTLGKSEFVFNLKETPRLYVIWRTDESWGREARKPR